MKLLFVNGCISQRGEESRTLVLARTFLDAWQARHPEAEVETVEPEEELVRKYEERYQKFREIYPTVKALYDSLAE